MRPSRWWQPRPTATWRLTSISRDPRTTTTRPSAARWAREDRWCGWPPCTVTSSCARATFLRSRRPRLRRRGSRWLRRVGRRLHRWRQKRRDHRGRRELRGLRCLTTRTAEAPPGCVSPGCVAAARFSGGESLLRYCPVTTGCYGRGMPRWASTDWTTHVELAKNWSVAWTWVRRKFGRSCAVCARLCCFCSFLNYIGGVKRYGLSLVGQSENPDVRYNPLGKAEWVQEKGKDQKQSRQKKRDAE